MTYNDKLWIRYSSLQKQLRTLDRRETAYRIYGGLQGIHTAQGLQRGKPDMIQVGKHA